MHSTIQNIRYNLKCQRLPGNSPIREGKIRVNFLDGSVQKTTSVQKTLR